MFELSPEKRSAFREVRYVLQRRTDQLEDSVPEDTIEPLGDGSRAIQPETELFMDEAYMDRRSLTDEEVAEQPYIMQLMLELTVGFVDAQLARYQRVLDQYKRRAEACGCRKCWAEYENLRDEYIVHFGVPDAEHDVSPRVMAETITKYAPKLD